jgi:hypothetical protein
VRPDVLPAYRRSGRAETAATRRGGGSQAGSDVTPFTSALPPGNMQGSTGQGGPRTAWLERRDSKEGAMGLLGIACGRRASPGGCSSSRSSHADHPDHPGHTRPAGGRCRKRRTQRLHSRGRRCVAVGSTGAQLGVLHHQDSPLCLAQTSPDAVRLTDAQCVTEARFPHGAGSAYGFRLLLPLELLALSLEVRRWEEDDGLRPTTCSTNLPVFLNTLCAHRHTPLPSRTIQPVLFRNKENLPRARGASGGRLPGQRGCRCLLTAACTRMRTAPGRGNASAVNSACGRESHSPDGPRSR